MDKKKEDKKPEEKKVDVKGDEIKKDKVEEKKGKSEKDFLDGSKEQDDAAKKIQEQFRKKQEKED
jgi:hypothetical protein